MHDEGHFSFFFVNINFVFILLSRQNGLNELLWLKSKKQIRT